MIGYHESIKEQNVKHIYTTNMCRLFFFNFLAFDFSQLCMVIAFFHPRHYGQWIPTSKDLLSQILSITFIFLS